MTSTVSWTTVSLMLATLPAIGSRTSVTSTDMALFAGRAESMMRAKLSQLYSLPFEKTYDPLETIATDLACYMLLSRRIFTTERQNESPWVDRFKESMESLDKIVEGKIPLIDPDTGGLVAATNLGAEVWSSTQAWYPTITEDIEELQIVDPDKLQTIRDDRGI